MCTRRELPGLTGPVRQTQTSADRAWRGSALSAVEAGRIVRLLPTNCALLLRPNPPNVNRWSLRPQRGPDIAARPVQLYRISAARPDGDTVVRLLPFLKEPRSRPICPKPSA